MSQLIERRSVTVHPYVHLHPGPNVVSLRPVDQHHRGRHLTAGIPTLVLSGTQGGQHPSSQGPGTGLKRLCHRRPHAVARHHVGLHAVPVADLVASVVDALISSERRNRSSPIDDRHLSECREPIRRPHIRQGALGIDTGRQQGKTPGTIPSLTKRLRGYRPHPGPRPQHRRAHRKHTGGDSGTELARRRVPRHYRIGHVPYIQDWAPTCPKGVQFDDGRRTGALEPSGIAIGRRIQGAEGRRRPSWGSSTPSTVTSRKSSSSSHGRVASICTGDLQVRVA